jgi:hypothetical protein
VNEIVESQNALRNTGKNSLATSEMVGDAKNIHQSGIKWGSKQALSQTRHPDHEYKPYDNFTKEWDQTQVKTRLRIPY